MLIIGHRGARGYIAENTLESIQKALDLNVDGVEIDVYQCASGEIVVFHDSKLNRLTSNRGFIEKTNFDELNTMITWYHNPYQKEHLKKLKMKKLAEWVEYRIQIYSEKDAPQKVKKFSNLIMRRYNLKALNFKRTKDIVPYIDEMFDLLNKTYNTLQTFVPIQQYQIDHYKDRYLRYIHPEFIKSVADKDGNLIAFAITMPSFSRALKKMNGKLFPFGFLRILKSQWFNNRASLYLIGVHPEYQNKGVTAILFNDLQSMFNKRGIKEVETNPELVENKSIQAFWKNYESVLHKKRSTYTKEI